MTMGIRTDVSRENLMSLLKQIEQASSIMWPGSEDCEPTTEKPTDISLNERKEVKTLYYSDYWKGLMTYGPTVEDEESYEVMSNEEFLKTLSEILPKQRQQDLKGV